MCERFEGVRDKVNPVVFCKGCHNAVYWYFNFTAFISVGGYLYNPKALQKKCVDHNTCIYVLPDFDLYVLFSRYEYDIIRQYNVTWGRYLPFCQIIDYFCAYKLSGFWKKEKELILEGQLNLKFLYPYRNGMEYPSKFIL